MSAIDKRTGTSLVDKAGDAAGELKDIVDGRVGKDILVAAGERQMGFDVPGGLNPIHMADTTLDVNALANRRVGLELEFLPELSLSGQNKGHRALRVHLEIHIICN